MDDFYYCPGCGILLPKIKEIAAEREHKGYDSKNDFIKAFNKLQGKDSSIPLDLYDRLDDYCRANSFLTSVEIRAMPLKANGTRGDMTLDFLQFLLCKTKNKAQYENIPLIAHAIVTGKQIGRAHV